MKGLRTAIYKVADLTEGKRWYARAFGTDPYFDEDFYVGFDIGGYELGLLPTEGEEKEKGDYVVAYWGVEDIDREFKHFLNEGAEAHEEPFSVGGSIMTATVKDPWGNVIGLIFNPEFKIKE